MRQNQILQQQQIPDSYIYNPKQYDDQILTQLSQGNESKRGLKGLVKNFTNGIQGSTAQNKNLVLIMGISGVGKTTLAAYLSGIELECKEMESEEYYLDYPANSSDKRLIGQSNIDSQTKFPNLFQTKHGFDFIDCPGFQDSQGLDTDILNSFYTHFFLKQALAIKIILAIDGSILEQSGGGLGKCKWIKILVEQMVSMTKGTSFNLATNLLIVMTKCSKSLSYYKEKFAYQITQVSQDSDFMKRLNSSTNFLNAGSVITQLQQAKIELFCCPQGRLDLVKFAQGRDSILDIMREIHYYKNNDMSVSLSYSAFEKISQYVKDYENLLEQNILKKLNKIGNLMVSSSQIQQYINTLNKYKQYLTKSNQNDSLCIYTFWTQFVDNVISLSRDSSLKSKFKNKQIEFFKRVVFDLLLNKINSDFSYSKVISILLQNSFSTTSDIFQRKFYEIQKEEKLKLLEQRQQEKVMKQEQLQNSLRDLNNNEQLQRKEICDLRERIAKEKSELNNLKK